MDELDRRSVVRILSVAGAAALLNQGGLTAAPARVSDRTELFLVGPFSVSEWFLTNPKAVFNLDGSPTVDDIAKWLGKVRAYLIDQREGSSSARRFSDGFPQIALQGELSHTWEKGKSEWNAHIVKTSAGGADTDNRPDPPIRSGCLLTIAIWFRETTNGQVTGESVWNYGSSKIRYDLTGAIRTD